MACHKEDNEIFKKFFAKSICNDMPEEKVTVVKVLIMKLASLVPRGYSKSTDKIADHLVDQGNSEVNQFMDESNNAI